MKLTFLGTGTSFGIPQIGCECAVCRSTDPRDKRTRVGALVESGDTHLLIDTPPELRQQLVAAGVKRVNALFFTHDHADHTHGIDDVRALSVAAGVPIPAYGPAETMRNLAHKFPYIFDQSLRPLPGTTKPEVLAYPLESGVPVRVGSLDVVPFDVPHGPARVFGYRIGALGYVTDAKQLPDDAVALLRHNGGVRVLVINALFRAEHPTHLSVAQAVAVAQRVGAERTFLTHLTHDNMHAALQAELPAGIAPAFDGLQVTIDEP